MVTELEILCNYIKTETGYEGQLDVDVDLLETKILDSFSVVQLAVFIEEHFSIELEAEDLVRANLAKLSSIIALIEKRRAARS
jgi:acyl carrier protein